MVLEDLMYSQVSDGLVTREDFMKTLAYLRDSGSSASETRSSWAI